MQQPRAVRGLKGGSEDQAPGRGVKRIIGWAKYTFLTCILGRWRVGAFTMIPQLLKELCNENVFKELLAVAWTQWSTCEESEGLKMVPQAC